MSVAETMPPEVDVEMARRFLRLVDANDTFTFQTFHDRQKDIEEDRTLARIIPGPAGKELLNLHDRGAGVYFTVNRTDGAGRKGQNITNIRAVWQEDDDGVAVNFPIEPSLVVESSPGRFHRYWLLAEPWPADEHGRADHAAVMERMIEAYGSDKNAKDLCRVLRVPGFLNRKHGDPHQVRIVSSPGWRYSRAEILAAFPPVEHKERKAPQLSVVPQAPRNDDEEDRRVCDALFSIDATDRHVWLTMGMAIEAHYGEAGRSLWDEWSLTAKDKYNERDQDRTWRSFKGSGISIGTLFHYAKHGGWEDGTQRLYEEWCRKHQEQKDDGASAEASADLGGVFTFLGDAPAAPPRELIKKLLPAYGVAVTGGQSTAGKTFIQIHKSICLATARPYFEHSIVERVGTVFIAAEGRSLIPNRFEAGLKKAGITEKLPIAWIKRLPDFSTLEGTELFVAQLKAVDERFKGDFGVRLGQIVIDTIAACFVMKDEDDNAEATKVCGILGSIGEEVGALMAPVHHYGKNPESGLRGASAWKGSADVVEGVLADVDPLSGKTSNRELVCAKARDGEQGPLSPFELEWVGLGIDDDGEAYGSCAVIPSEGASRFDKSAVMSKGQRSILDAINEVMDGRSEIITPRAGMAPVKAVRVSDVREEFDRRYITAETDPAKAAHAKRMAFKRALDRLSPSQFGAGSTRSTDWIWREL
jgi:hypothetical protein